MSSSKTGSKSAQQDKQLQDALAEELGTGKKPERINLGDTPALKRALDDAAIETIRNAGYPIDYTLTDIKIAIGGSACIIALIAQFYPGKTPTTLPLLITCVSVYTLLSVLLTVFHAAIEKDAIAMTKGKGKGKSKDRLIIRSTLPRYQDVYTFGVRLAGTAAGGAEEVNMAKSVGLFFDSEGILVTEAITKEIQKLIATLESKKAQ